MLYRILTEDMNRDGIMEIIDRHFTGYTLYQTRGIYEGKAEHAMVIEIDTGTGINPVGARNERDMMIKDIVEQIKKLNDQECVLVQKIDCESEFI